MSALRLDPDRLFPADPATRGIARRLFATIEPLPIISPHGHCDPSWFASNAPFTDPATLLITPDHYLTRMVHSAGVPLESLGLTRADGGWSEPDSRNIWRRFANSWPLFRGTPSRLWLQWVFAEIFGLEERLQPSTADHYFDVISHALATPGFHPRALFERFNIEALATTEGGLGPLSAHFDLRESGWSGRVIPTFRPDDLTNPDHPRFRANLITLAELTGEDTATYRGYLRGLENRREIFRSLGATATDHGHPTALTVDLPPARAEALFHAVAHGAFSPAEAERFRGHMLMEMARMSADDGMTMQLHPGSVRDHDLRTLARFGHDRGADIPCAIEFVGALKPLLNRFGQSSEFTFVVFTLDETAYARELAPLAGFYPVMKLGAPWWFNDSPEGMRRFREQATETAGFYNTVGFTDDTRAFLSIPARHDVARRMDCSFLARLVAEGRLDEDEAAEVAHALTYHLAKAAYRL